MLYAVLAIAVLYGVGSLGIYGALTNTRLISELQRQPLNINIFDPTPLEPVARLSLGISLTLIGGITLALLLFPDPKFLLRPEGILVNGTLIVVAVLVFFLTMGNTHRVMADAKERELKLVRHNLSTMYQELKERTARGELEGMESFSDAITAWLAYQKVIEDAPEWPYTTDLLRNLVVSTFVPILAWAAQILVELVK